MNQDRINQLRKQLKRQRAQLPKATQQQLSTAASKHLRHSRLFRAARHIALYLPVRGEADPTGLIRHAHPRQRFYLPVLSPSKTQGLVFVEWGKSTRFRNNRFNIPEPLPNSSARRKPASLDLVILPLLGFDHTGTRLGMGGGYYDRSFAFRLRSKAHTRPTLVGFAYAFQLVPHLERQHWDVPLDVAVTHEKYTLYRH